MTLYYFLAYLVAYRVSLPALFLQVTICEVFLTLPLQPIKLQHLVSQARGRIGKLGNVFFTLLGDEHSIDNNTNEFANILCNIFFITGNSNELNIGGDNCVFPKLWS